MRKKTSDEVEENYVVTILSYDNYESNKQEIEFIYEVVQLLKLTKIFFSENKSFYKINLLKIKYIFIKF